MAEQLETSDRPNAALYSTLMLDRAGKIIRVLGRGGKSIRVLDIFPGQPDTELHLVLRVIALNSTQYYETLSYTWGASTLGRKVTVNGHAFAVTDNLFNTLHRLRKKRGIRTLWADQLCIDQTNRDERSQQVALMGKIYHQAALVNVWLGEPSVEPHPPDSKSKIWSEERIALRRALQGHARMIASAIRNAEPLWHYRAWVVQEFVLSRKIYFCCGHKRWQYSERWLKNLENLSVGLEGLYARTNTMERYRVRIGLSDSMVELRNPDRRLNPSTDLDIGDLYDVITTSSSTTIEASDRRDYLYSIIGLISPEEADFIGCNYNGECPRIFAKATFASIKKRGNFDILDMVSRKRRTGRMASWAVDFAMPNRLWQYSANNDRFFPEKCVLAKELKLPSAKASFDEWNGKLTMSGSYLDTIVGTLAINLYTIDEIWEKLITDFVGTALASMRVTQRNSNLLAFLEKFGIYPSFGVFSSQIRRLSYEVAAKDSHLTSVRVGAALTATFKLWTSLCISPEIRDEEAFQAKLAEVIDTFDPKDYGDRFWILVDLLLSSLSPKDPPDPGIRLFATSAGVIGLALDHVRVGDCAVLIRAHKPTIALRPYGRDYTFQGHVHMHPFWNEECLPVWASMNFEEESFVLI